MLQLDVVAHVETDKMTTPWHGQGESFYCRYKRENIQRHLEESRPKKGRSRLTMTSSLDLREAGGKRGDEEGDGEEHR